jgi:hypothetical protein
MFLKFTTGVWYGEKCNSRACPHYAPPLHLAVEATFYVPSMDDDLIDLPLPSNFTVNV